MTSKPKRAALYLRVSTDGQRLDNQWLALEAASQQRGWQVVQVYADNGVSGAKGRAQRSASAMAQRRGSSPEWEPVPNPLGCGPRDDPRPLVAPRLLVRSIPQPHIQCASADTLCRDSAAGCDVEISPNLKELVMTPKFLREEAARFRGMAESVDREASKLRFLAMATDFEARANIADALIGSNPDEASHANAGKRTAKERKSDV